MTSELEIKILIIDDDPIIRRNMMFYLEEHGFDVLEAKNGKIGLELFYQEQPNLVITDLHMPEMDGFKVLETLLKESPETPIIVCSGTGAIHTAIEASRLGAWDFITKPITDMSVVAHAIQKTWERSILLRENQRYKQHLEEEVRKRTGELEDANYRLKRLLEMSREMAASGSIFQMLLTSLAGVLQVLTVKPSARASMYFREKSTGTEGYAFFSFPTALDSKGNPLIKMDDLSNVEHSFFNNLPSELAKPNMSHASYLVEDTLCLPCLDEENVLGLLKIDGIHSTPIPHETMEFIKTLHQSLSISIKNISYHRKIEEQVFMEIELKTAAALQHTLLPKTMPQIDNLEFASFYRSASQTGGDWYGFMTQIENHLFILIGDVTGHGTPAALITAVAGATCRSIENLYAQQKASLSPGNVLSQLNHAIWEAGNSEYWMTFFVADIDLVTGRMVYSNAGHNFPIILRPQEQVKHLLNANSILGSRKETRFKENVYQLEVGDTLIFYTDGLIENRSPDGKSWEEQGLIRYFRKNKNIPIQQLLDQLVLDVYSLYDTHPIEDDITIVGCQVVRPFLNG